MKRLWLRDGATIDIKKEARSVLNRVSVVATHQEV
jgi:hypothetical protein